MWLGFWSYNDRRIFQTSHQAIHWVAYFSCSSWDCVSASYLPRFPSCLCKSCKHTHWSTAAFFLSFPSWPGMWSWLPHSHVEHITLGKLDTSPLLLPLNQKRSTPRLQIYLLLDVYVCFLGRGDFYLVFGLIVFSFIFFIAIYCCYTLE